MGLLAAGTWRMRSAVSPCCARAWALAPAVVAVSDAGSTSPAGALTSFVTSLVTTLPDFAIALLAIFLSSDSFRDEAGSVVAPM